MKKDYDELVAGSFLLWPDDEWLEDGDELEDDEWLEDDDEPDDQDDELDDVSRPTEDG